MNRDILREHGLLDFLVFTFLLISCIVGSYIIINTVIKQIWIIYFNIKIEVQKLKPILANYIIAMLARLCPQHFCAYHLATILNSSLKELSTKECFTNLLESVDNIKQLIPDGDYIKIMECMAQLHCLTNT